MHHLDRKAYLFLIFKIFKREEKMHPMPSNQTPFGSNVIYYLVVKFGRWESMNKITQIKRKKYSEHIKMEVHQPSEDKHDVITMYMLCVVNYCLPRA